MRRPRVHLPVFGCVGAVCAAVIGLAFSGGCLRPRVEPVSATLCIAVQPPSALVFIAVARGYFELEGIQLTVKEYVSGKRALKAMLAGDGDLATSAEVPIVFESLLRDDFLILAQIGATGNAGCIVARADSGIVEGPDLRGKKIATQGASAVHFLLHMFLLKHGLSDADVDISFLRAEELPGALASGAIHAFAMREPYVSQARALLQGQVTVLEENGLYLRTEHVVMRKETALAEPELATRFLRALVRAERYAEEHPTAATALVADALGLSVSRAEEVLADLHLEVSLEQSMLAGLEDEAKWAIEGGLTEATAIPNYLDLIDIESLAAVKPEAVTVIH